MWKTTNLSLNNISEDAVHFSSLSGHYKLHLSPSLQPINESFVFQSLQSNSCKDGKRHIPACLCSVVHSSGELQRVEVSQPAWFLLETSQHCCRAWLWNTAEMYLAVNSTRVSSFFEEDIHGSENAWNGSKIQHFPPSSQHSKRFLMQPRMRFHDSLLSGDKEKLTLKSQWWTNKYPHTENVQLLTSLPHCTAEHSHISYGCRITAGALEQPASAHSCQWGRVGCTGMGLWYLHLPLHNTVTNTVWEGK